MTDLHNSQEDETGVIVCNGPSLNSTDLSLLAGRPYILMNRGYLLADRIPSPPTALCVSARPVLEQYGKDIESLATTLVLSEEDRELLDRSSNVAYTLFNHRWQFATRIGDSLYPGFTVTFLALQLAYHLGWSKTLIVGMDHRYDQTGDPSVMTTTKGVDQNHFDPNYFEHGSKWLLPALQMNEHSYTLARDAYESTGREVVDCTVAGACQIFRKSTLGAELP